MKTTSLRKGSRYHGFVIVERLDSRKKNYRQVYRCISDDRDCVLVRFILKDVPSSLVQLDDLHLPTEYVFVDCYNSMYPVEVLPNIISCDFDSDEAWYVRDYISGTSLREEVGYCHRMNGSENDNKLLDAFVNWLIMSGHMFNMFLPTNMKYNLTPDNLFISRESDGSPKLLILDLESAFSVEADITNDYKINADTRYLPPEIFCNIFNDKSIVYTFAMLVIFSLRRSLPESYNKTGYLFEPLIGILNDKDRILEDVNVSEEKRSLLLEALDPNPGNRPTYDEFTRKWSNCIEPETSSNSTDTSMRDGTSNNLDLGAPNKFDAMFRKGTGGGFKDIAGMEELKNRLLHTLIYPVKYPEIAETYGIKMPNGIMMYGPPGCGKSFLAEKFCEEINCLYIVIKASDLGGQWHREGLSNIGELFSAAERQSKMNNSPVCIILNEADGIIQIRNQEMSSGAAAETNQFLTELETCSQRGIIVIATSNDPRQIDPAALRSGRLGDMSIHIPLPDAETKGAILKMELSKRPCKAIDIDEMIVLTKNFTSSDIAEIARKSAVYAMSHMISSIEKGTPTLTVPITGDIVRKVIMETTPSIPDYELQKQIQIHESFSNMRKNKTSKIGFHSSKVG